jgi:hypothetical protein
MKCEIATSIEYTSWNVVTMETPMNYFALIPKDIIKYFYERYCAKECDAVWRRLWPMVSTYYADDTAIVAYAAREGHTDLLEYAMKIGLDIDDAREEAAKGMRMDVLVWLRDLSPFSSLSSWSPDCCAYASENGDLTMLMWLLRYGCHAKEKTILMAALNNRVNILEWIKRKGPIYWENGDALDIGWLKDNTWICGNLAERGHLDTIKWLKNNGIFRYHDIVFSSATFGHLAIIAWVNEKIQSRDQIAYPELVTWLVENSHKEVDYP